MSSINQYPTVYFPDTGKPVPAVLTPEEVCRVLRLDGDGQEQIKSLRGKGLLKGRQYTKQMRYLLPDVLRAAEMA